MPYSNKLCFRIERFRIKRLEAFYYAEVENNFEKWYLNFPVKHFWKLDDILGEMMRDIVFERLY